MKRHIAALAALSALATASCGSDAPDPASAPDGIEGAIHFVSQPPEGEEAIVAYVDVAGIREAVGYDGTYDLEGEDPDEWGVSDQWAMVVFYLPGAFPARLLESTDFADVDWYVSAFDADLGETTDRWLSGYAAGIARPEEETVTIPDFAEVTATPGEGGFAYGTEGGGDGEPIADEGDYAELAACLGTAHVAYIRAATDETLVGYGVRAGKETEVWACLRGEDDPEAAAREAWTGDPDEIAGIKVDGHVARIQFAPAEDLADDPLTKELVFFVSLITEDRFAPAESPE